MPASWLTSSGWPARLATSRHGRSSVLSTATEPEMIRTLNAATPSKSRVVGASIVQRGIARSFLPGSGSRSAHHIPAGDAGRLAGRPAVKLVLTRYVALFESQDVSLSL